VMVTIDAAGVPRGELLSAPHNGTNAHEVVRVRAEHPGEPECVRDGRVLGVIGPFRCKLWLNRHSIAVFLVRC
jgi:hypothetical protein